MCLCTNVSFSRGHSGRWRGGGRASRMKRQRDFHCPGYPSAAYPHWLAEWGRGPCVLEGGQHPSPLYTCLPVARVTLRVRLLTRETAAGSMGFLKNGKVLSGFQTQDGPREPAPSHGFLSQSLCSPSGCPRASTRRHTDTGTDVCTHQHSVLLCTGTQAGGSS